MCAAFFTPVFAGYYLNLQDFLNSYFNVVIQKNQLPSSYKYIQLKYTNIPEGTKLYTTLQKAVYLDLFPNAHIALPLDKPLTQQQAISIMSQGFDGLWSGDIKQLVTVDWLRDILLDVQDMQIKKWLITPAEDGQNNPLSQSLILQDIYTRLNTSYISSGSLDQNAMIYWWIKGMVEGLNDPYTSFFPPTDAQSFNDEIQGQYYGIGAYVEMHKPWEMMIIAPMKGSPAEKAGLKWGDRILQIGDHQVTQEISIDTATSWIKWPAGTTITLKILRDMKVLNFTVTRAKVVVKNVDSTIYGSWANGSICSVALRMFDVWIANEFDAIMKDLSTKHCTKYIFDLRNNPGGSLEDVARMLNYFVPTQSPSIIVKSKFQVEQINADNTLYPKLTGDKVRVLINGWSASASEIFAGVIRDYVPHALLIGEKSYGKWSVQNLLGYPDGSMFKYTVAKRYTGKSQQNIDKIWIKPDVTIVDATGTTIDEVMEYALKH